MRTTVRLDEALLERARQEATRRGVTLTSLIEPRHWQIFERLCAESKATGNLVQDAWFAALAVESGCEWITTDRDYARFTGLSWRPPLPR
jgi:predicted nucleic acid-binding protein